MKYRVTVFFDGPRSVWADRLDDCEIIFTTRAPWLWLARALARGNAGNTGRCAYAIDVDGVVVEEVRASLEYSPAR